MSFVYKSSCSKRRKLLVKGAAAEQPDFGPLFGDPFESFCLFFRKLDFITCSVPETPVALFNWIISSASRFRFMFFGHSIKMHQIELSAQ